MAKKPVSVPLKKKPAKPISRRRKLKSALKNIFNYIKSDTYMFAPFIHPQSSPPISSGELSLEPMKKKEQKLVEELKEYLKCDAYMYAPFVKDSACDGTTTPPLEGQRGGNVCDQMGSRSEVDDEHMVISSRDDDDDDGGRHDPMRRIVLEHSLLQSERVKHVVHQNCLLQSERVKHVVHQNCRSLSAAGEVLSPKKARKAVRWSEVGERAHAQLI